MKILHLKNFPIFRQLQVEEALLRLDTSDICIINEGSTPAIVMGISGKPEELINENTHAQNPIPIIKRYSGGGTVVVDEDTIFISFLCQKANHPFEAFPEPIMRWTEEIYKQALNLPDFALRENDYVIGSRKCGGNAQYIRKERFVHHTTFLWDYKKEHMQLLAHPKKTPQYRAERSHEEFLTKLSDHMMSKESILEDFKRVLSNRYNTETIQLDDLLPLLEKPHRQSTQQLEMTWTL